MRRRIFPSDFGSKCSSVLSRFGCPQKLVTDNAKAFNSKAMVSFCEKNGILLKHSTPYYPRGNGLAESSNKNII